MIGIFSVALLLIHSYCGSSAEAVSLTTTVTHSKSDFDQLEFTTTDKDICPHFSARFRSYDGAKKVICSCGSGEIFYGVNDETPKCQHQDSGKLFGCPCTERTCANVLPIADSSVLARWHFFNVFCQANISSYRVLFWDGSAFTTTHSGSPHDFEMYVTPDKKKTEVKLEWKKPRPSYEPYQGKLIKFEINCNTHLIKKCFLAKGLGSSTLTLDVPAGFIPTTTTTTTTSPTPPPTTTRPTPPPPTPSTSTKMKKTIDVGSSKEDSESNNNMMIVVVVAAAIVVLIIAILFFIYWSKRNLARNNHNNADQVQPPPVVFYNHPGSESVPVGPHFKSPYDANRNQQPRRYAHETGRLHGNLNPPPYAPPAPSMSNRSAVQPPAPNGYEDLHPYDLPNP